MKEPESLALSSEELRAAAFAALGLALASNRGLLRLLRLFLSLANELLQAPFEVRGSLRNLGSDPVYPKTPS